MMFILLSSEELIWFMWSMSGNLTCGSLPGSFSICGSEKGYVLVDKLFSWHQGCCNLELETLTIYDSSLGFLSGILLHLSDSIIYFLEYRSAYSWLLNGARVVALKSL